MVQVSAAHGLIVHLCQLTHVGLHSHSVSIFFQVISVTYPPRYTFDVIYNARLCGFHMGYEALNSNQNLLLGHQ